MCFVDVQCYSYLALEVLEEERHDNHVSYHV